MSHLLGNSGYGATSQLMSILGKRLRRAQTMNVAQELVLAELEAAKVVALATNNSQSTILNTLQSLALNLIPTATGELDLGDNRVVNVADPVDDQDALTKKYFLDHTTLNSVALNQIPVPTGSVSMNSFRIVNLLDPVAVQDAASKHYVDTNTIHATTTLNLIPKAAGSVDLNTQKIVNLLDPTLAQDAASKHYVDTKTIRADTIVAGTGATISLQVNLATQAVDPATNPVTYVPVRISGVAKPIQGTDAVSLFYLSNDYDIPLRQYVRDQDVLERTFATGTGRTDTLALAATSVDAKITLERTFATGTGRTDTLALAATDVDTKITSARAYTDTKTTAERTFSTGTGRTDTLTLATTNAKALRLDQFAAAMNDIFIGTNVLAQKLTFVKDGTAAQDAATINNLLTYLTTYAWTRSGQVVFGNVSLVAGGTLASISTTGYLNACSHIASAGAATLGVLQTLTVKTYQLEFPTPGFDVSLNFSWNCAPTTAGYASTIYGLGHGIPAIVHAPDAALAANGLASYYVTAVGITNYRSKITICCKHIEGTFTTQTLNVQFIRALQS